MKDFEIGLRENVLYLFDDVFLLDKTSTSSQPCYHHNIKEPTKVIELEPQEQNRWNTKAYSKNDNIFYSKYLRNKASSDSSVDQLRNQIEMGSPSHHIISTVQNTFSDRKNVNVGFI